MTRSSVHIQQRALHVELCDRGDVNFAIVALTTTSRQQPYEKCAEQQATALMTLSDNMNAADDDFVATHDD
jgi:hypothetical protein